MTWERPSPEDARRNAGQLADEMMRELLSDPGSPPPGSAGWRECRRILTEVLLDVAREAWADSSFGPRDHPPGHPFRTDSGARTIMRDLLRETRGHLLADVVRQAEAAAHAGLPTTGAGATSPVPQRPRPPATAPASKRALYAAWTLIAIGAVLLIAGS